MNDTTYTLQRLRPRLNARFATHIKRDPIGWQTFLRRLDEHFPRLFTLLRQLYANQYDFFYYLEELLATLAEGWLARPADLRALDEQREAHPNWFESHQMLGGVCYVDLFANDLEGLRAKLPYFQELGLTYLHLMPLFDTPEGENDGGYAVSSYRTVNPQLGNIQQLRALAQDLRAHGISLVLDFILNHTSDQHEWAQKARANDPLYRQFYFIFPDRTLPDAYEQHLREIFPDEHPGAFSPLNRESAGSIPADVLREGAGDEIKPPRPLGERWGEGQDWVWTTFHRYQWDLNYTHPATFNQMTAEMLFLANLGTEVLRFDALAFVWKKLGTTCESLPEAHLLLQAFNAACRIAAPGLLFKSEAIVHPDEVIRYISPQECQLSYNPLLMALLWNSLATREINLLQQALATRHALPNGTAWVNYIRCHDDIGWTFSDEDAAHFGINGYDHRRFLNNFYTGRFPGSFARGLPFQENPKTGDARISGTAASLAGLEKALREGNPHEIELAIGRILLLHSVILTVGGIPLIYLGDEIGQLNDYTYRADPAKAHDSRWVHRPAANWEQFARRNDPNSIEGRIYQNLQRMIALRKAHPAFSGNALQVIRTENPQVLGYVRHNEQERLLIFANFGEHPQTLPANLLRLYGLTYTLNNLLTNTPLPLQDLPLAAYEFVCLQGQANA
ncbi:MAG: alpha-amylase family glycosyl hydrolase [Anaerolineales bacterium]